MQHNLEHLPEGSNLYGMTWSQILTWVFWDSNLQIFLNDLSQLENNTDMIIEHPMLYKSKTGKILSHIQNSSILFLIKFYETKFQMNEMKYILLLTWVRNSGTCSWCTIIGCPNRYHITYCQHQHSQTIHQNSNLSIMN